MNNTRMNQKTLSLRNFSIGAFLLLSLLISVGAGYREPIATVDIDKQITAFERAYCDDARVAVVGGVGVKAAHRIFRNDCRGVVRRANIQTKKPRLKSVGIT